MTTAHPQLLLLGVGNEYRRDDAVGIVAARRLRKRTSGAVSILERNGEGTTLLEAWAGYSTVCLIDAVDCGAPPGRVLRLEAHAAKLPSRLFHRSTHAFGVAEAVELARALNQLPGRLLLYGIQGQDFRDGVGLSAEVETGVSLAMQQVLEELPAWLDV